MNRGSWEEMSTLHGSLDLVSARQLDAEPHKGSWQSKNGFGREQPPWEQEGAELGEESREVVLQNPLQSDASNVGLHAALSAQQEPSHRHIDRPYIRASSSSTAPTTRGHLSTLVS